MKFNLLSKLTPIAIGAKTVNHAGAKAFTLSPEMELYPQLARVCSDGKVRQRTRDSDR